MRLFLFLSSFIFCLHSIAQKVTVNVSNTNDVTAHTIDWRLREKNDFRIGKDIIRVENTGSRMQLAYTAKLSREKHALVLHKLDTTGKEIATSKLDNGERTFGPGATVPLLFNDKLLLIYFRYDDKDTMKIFFSEVDINTLSLKNTKLLFRFAQRDAGVIGMASMNFDILTTISPDAQKLLVAYKTGNQEMLVGVLKADLTVMRTKTSRPAFPEKSDLADVYMDNAGNCAFALTSSYGSAYSHAYAKGIYIQRNDNAERMITLENVNGEFTPEHLHIQPSSDFTRLFAFGEYAGDRMMEGVWIAEIQIPQMRLAKTFAFSYTEEFRLRMHKTGFGVKKKDNYTVMPVNYQLIHFDDGDFALTGYAKLENEGQNTSGKLRYTLLAGPVVSVFIDKTFKRADFAMIPRNHTLRSGSAGLFVPYKDKLVILYNDYAQHFSEDLTDESVDRLRVNMVKEISLGYAVINKSGKIEQRKLLVDGISRMNYFNTQNFTRISSAHFLIPSAAEDKEVDMNKVAEVVISD